MLNIIIIIIIIIIISALSDFKDFLSGNQTVGSCFIIVEAGEIIKEMQKKSSGTPYQDLLRKASNTVGKNSSCLSRSSREVCRLSSNVLFETH